MSNLEAMSAEELQERLDGINRQRDELTAEARQVAEVLNRKLALKAAEDKVAGMSEAERAALTQVLQAQGIASGEAVWTGGK